MGSGFRHFKALMKKNWINWKRTICQSICELVCPVALMAILSLARLAVSTTDYSEQSQIELSSIYYPVKELNLSGSQNFFDIMNFTDQQSYQAFYNFSDLDSEKYNPINYFITSSCEATDFDAERSIIGYSPDNEYTRYVVRNLQNIIYARNIFLQNSDKGSRLLQNFERGTQESGQINFKFQAFGSDQDIIDYLKDTRYMKDSDHPGLCFAYSINSQDGSKFTSSLFFNDKKEEGDQQSLPDQKEPVWQEINTQADTLNYKFYTTQAYNLVQNLIANSILALKTKNSNATIALTTVPFKTPAYTEDQFSQVIEGLLPFFLLLMYILPVFRMLQRILSEKESRARESMKMMGLKDLPYWLSWFTYYLIITTIISFLCFLLAQYNVIVHSSTGLIFLYFWMYGLSLFGFVVFFQAFFTSSRSGAIAGTLIYFGTSFIDTAVQDASTSASMKLGVSIFSTVAVARGAVVLSVFEVNGIGIHMDNIDYEYENYTFQWCLLMMIASFFTFLIVGLYLEQVLPQTFGVRKPWYFCLLPKYYCSIKKKNNLNRARIEQRDQENRGGEENLELRSLNPQNYEPASNDVLKQEQENKILKVDGLQKVFSNGFQAVRGVNLKMYSGQIFALLGHNGAGKTTTISMLTGLIENSHGTANIFGDDLFENMGKVREYLGICPQHDVLFDLLTPIEHLQIFCDFKGVDSKKVQKEILQIIKDVDLEKNKNTMAKQLSGGNRRKLSVAIALIGGSKFVLLDEPTSGMDLSSRRRLWDMLKNYKHDRIILLTTHYMDEADILGDRIGIMAEGKVICLGSSLFLKNRFGVGYNLNMVKKDKQPNSKIDSYLKQQLGNEVQFLSEVSSEIIYQIPTALSNKFDTFFQKFDQEKEHLDILSYGISITTLEEVFLRVGHGEESLQDSLKHKALNDESPVKVGSKDDDYSIAEQHETGIVNIFMIHSIALLRKKFFMYKRNYKSLMLEVLMPIVLVIIGFAFTKVSFFPDSPEREIVISQFPLNQRILMNEQILYPTNNSTSNISPRTLASSLIDSSSYNVTYKNYSSMVMYNTSLLKQDLSKVIKQYDSDNFDQRLIAPSEPYRYGSYFVFQANNLTKQFKVSTFINLTSQDVAAFFPAFIYSSIIKSASGDNNFELIFTTKPYPTSQKLLDRGKAASGTFIVFVIGIGFSLIPAAIISFIVGEREKNLRHQQLISGMSLSAYWFTNFIFDFCKAEIPMLLTIALIYIFDLNYEDVWLVLLLYPFGMISFTYASSFLFSRESAAQTFTIFLHFVFSGVGGIVVYVLRFIDSTKEIGDGLMWGLKVVPSFCLTNSVMFAAGKDQLLRLRTDIPSYSFDVVNMGGDILFIFLHFIIGIIALIIIETCLLGCFQNMMQKSAGKNGKMALQRDQIYDDDVQAEEERIIASSKDQINIRVKEFQKIYKNLCGAPFLAVENISFGVDYGECFCLLGVNGAGKSTTFKSLTNEVVPTHGEITINGLNINRDFNRVRKMIGYCPQYDMIFDSMSVEEHLDFYARIKGILKERRHDMIEQKIVEMNLTEHRHKPAGTLSGGNKRKLSVAMCVLGNPPIIFLDEPSAGMDPQARRFMWTVVSDISKKKKKSAVILTTHSMEEVEALSDKIGIMVKGGLFQCFGSSQQLKDKFGTGYEIEIKIRKLKPEDVEAKRIEFQIPQDKTSLTISECLDIMKQLQINQFLIDELKEGGLGNDIIKEANSYGGKVETKSFIIWLNIEIQGLKIIHGLLNDFKRVEILEHYSDYFKLKVAKEGKSIGYLFGLIEQNKQGFGIGEYSASQTTLEQIFQTFANININESLKGIVFTLENGRVNISKDSSLQRRSSMQRQASLKGNTKINS